MTQTDAVRRGNFLLILGIESSCDETALALVRDGKEVIASLIASQTKIHGQFGGVVPEVAAREHLRAIGPLFRQMVAETRIDAQAIDAIAITQGPGLVGALLVGVSFAKGMALQLGKPLIPVDHVHAHVHGAILGMRVRGEEPKFPLLALVVSGGHTNLYYMASATQFSLLAHTMDDACGECFDKVGKLLGLPYPGGPHIEEWAKDGDKSKFPAPTMVERKAQLAFSYSGLKTHMAMTIRRLQAGGAGLKLSESDVADLCASFQEEALGQIVRKLRSALALRPATREILIAGGVAANQRFRNLVANAFSVPVGFPPLEFCSDNAAMIAALGYEQYKAAIDKAQFDGGDGFRWDVYSRYEFEKYHADESRDHG